MKNVVDISSKGLVDRKVVEQEAVAWLVRLDGDIPLSSEEQRELKAWMSRSPAHVQELKSLNAFSKELLVLTELNVPMPRMHHTKPSKPQRRMAVYTAWATAAMVLIVVALLQLGGWVAQPSNNTNGVYVTAIGERRSVTLADGSHIVLNTDSHVRVDYTKRQRIIQLIQGEAHFDVVKDANRPFKVFAGQGQVQAIGTAFTVYLRDADVDVLVTEGVVELSAVALSPSQANLSAANTTDLGRESRTREAYSHLPRETLGRLGVGEGATIVVTPHQADPLQAQTAQLRHMEAGKKIRRDSWRQGVVLFAGDTLEEVVKEIGRYSATTIEIADPELNSIRIGGQFQVGDINGLLEALAYNFGLKVTVLDTHHIKITADQNLTGSEA